jgi:hypothetical protein
MEKVIVTVLFFCLNLFSFAQDYNAELVLQETNISYKNGKLIQSINYEIKIINREGEYISKISIPFSRLYKVSKIDAYIKDNNGIIIKKLAKSEITEKSAISDYSLYEDDYIKEFTLKHNTYPYTVCYSYEVQQEEFLAINYWLPVIDWKIPTVKAVLKVEVPKGFKISFRSQLTDSFDCDSTGIVVKYRWVASYNKRVEPETSSPNIVNFLPHVIIVPGDFKYNLPGSLRRWSDFGEWQNKLLKGLSDLPQSEKNTILGLISGLTDTSEKVRTLYHYLQDHTRYINITIETGGLKPYPASYVAVNKYGDCKALSNYFKSVLEAAGIKSYYTNVNAGDQITGIDKSFPSQQFNHVILCVPVLKDTLWLDCTSKMPFNYLGTFTQSRDVLIIEEDKSHFTKSPSMTNKDVLESRKATFHRNIQNQTIATFSNTYRGEEYETYFYLSNSVSNSDRTQIFRNNIVKGGYELIDFNLSVPPRDSARIHLSYSARSTKNYKVYGNDLLIEVLPFPVPRFEDPKKRKLPVQLDYPVYRIDSLEYEIPFQYNVSGKLTNESVVSEFGSYRIESVSKGKSVTVIKSFILKPGNYSLDRYKGFYDFLARVIEIESNNKIVTNKKF